MGNPPSVRAANLQVRQVHRDAGSLQGEPGRGIFHAAETSVEHRVSARGLSALMRHYTRLAAFSVPIVRRLIERPTSVPPDLRLVFDHAGSSTSQSTNLGDTTIVDQTAATVANLIRYRLPQYPKVLDVGCAAGTLAGELPPSVRYLGIDASESVIEAARSVGAATTSFLRRATSASSTRWATGTQSSFPRSSPI